MIRFSADSHFGHRNVITHCGRPWPDVEAMNEGLIEEWNAVVRPVDEVWHLGDFALSRRALEAVRSRLNGRIHLVLGNHDVEKDVRRSGLFETVQEVKYLRFEGMRFYLSHYAHRTWRNSVHGSFHLYGHSHGDLPGHGRSMDVGVDAVARLGLGYRPISVHEVVEMLSAREPTDHHALV